MEPTRNLAFGLLYLLTGAAMIAAELFTDIYFCLALDLDGFCVVGFLTLGALGVVIGGLMLIWELT